MNQRKRYIWTGLALGMNLLWAQGNFGIGTTAPTEKLDVEGGRLRVRAYSGTGTRLATVDPNGVFGTLAGNNPGEVLQWNGTAWTPATITAGDNWGTQTAATSAPIQGNGTAANPITFQPGTAAGQTWIWNGTAWTLGTPPGDNWGSQTATTSAPIQGNGTAANPITLQPGTAAGQILVWTGTAWSVTTPAVRNGLSFVTTPTPATELGGTLIKNTDIDLSGFNFTLSGTGNVGIGTTTPTERLHVEGNLRLQGAFMPNNLPGANGNLLLSAGAGAPPTWLPNGTNNQVLTIVGGVPQWANNNAICGTPTLYRFTKISSTSPAQVCNTTLAENTNNQIWNAGDGPATPFPGDKFSIYATGSNPYAISAYSSISNGTGVWGEGPTTGSGLVGVISSSNYFINAAGSFDNGAANGRGIVGRANVTNGIGVLGEGTQWAVYGNGNIGASGLKLFSIDHPLDPENKFLNHFATEGPEPYNLYRGIVVTDASGRAVVHLPTYFQAINKDFSYYLQPIGTFAQAIVEEEVQGNQFVIRTDKPYVKVSWMLIATRNDLYMRHFAKPTEEDKPLHYRGKYLLPQLYGKDDSYGIFTSSMRTRQTQALEKSSPKGPIPPKE